MANLSSLALTQAELDTMAHHLAYESATSFIDCNCVDVSKKVSADPFWFDIDPEGHSLESQGGIAEAVVYLEARGLLERHDDNPNWVTMFDESEATR